MTKKISLLLALICIISWSFIPVVARLGQMDLNNIQLLFWSNMLSALTVFVTALFSSKKIFSLNSKEYFYCAILGGLGCFLYYVLLYYGYAHEEADVVVIAQYSWPAMVVLLSSFLLKERLTMIRSVGCLLGIFAIALIITGGDFRHIAVNSPINIGLVLLGALCFSLFSVLSKNIKLDALISTFWFFCFATLFSGILLACVSEFKLPSRVSIVPVIINGALVNGLSYVLWIRALQLGRASILAPLVFIAPALAFIWIALFFDKEITIIPMLGLLLCLLSGIACVLEKPVKSD